MGSATTFNPAAIPMARGQKWALERRRIASAVCAVTAALGWLPDSPDAAEAKARLMVSATVVAVCRVDAPVATTPGGQLPAPAVDCGGAKASQARGADIRFKVCRQDSTEPDCARLLARFPDHDIMTVRFD